MIFFSNVDYNLINSGFCVGFREKVNGVTSLPKLLLLSKRADQEGLTSRKSL